MPRRTSSAYCEHAKESPKGECPCGVGCACRDHSCKSQSLFGIGALILQLDSYRDYRVASLDPLWISDHSMNLVKIDPKDLAQYKEINFTVTSNYNPFGYTLEIWTTSKITPGVKCQVDLCENTSTEVWALKKSNLRWHVCREHWFFSLYWKEWSQEVTSMDQKIYQESPNLETWKEITRQEEKRLQSRYQSKSNQNPLSVYDAILLDDF